MVAIGHILAIWPLVDYDWLHYLWPLNKGYKLTWSKEKVWKSVWIQAKSLQNGMKINVSARIWQSDFLKAWIQTTAWKLTPLLTPAIHPCWPQQCTFCSVILPTKFGSHWAFLSNVHSVWPLITLAWPLTLEIHYALIKGSWNQIRWPFGNFIAIYWMSPAWHLTPEVHYIVVRDSFYHLVAI